MTGVSCIRWTIVVALATVALAHPAIAQEPILEISEWAQEVVESFPDEERPTFNDGQLKMAENGSWAEFGRRFIAAARQQGLNSAEGLEFFDAETGIYLGASKMKLRLVLGRDGTFTQGEAGADGTSVPMFDERRSDLILIVAGGDGGSGWGGCHPGGAGGSAEATLSGKGGALLVFGGHSGPVGAHDCEIPSYPIDDPDEDLYPWQVTRPVGEDGAPGQDGGDGFAYGFECSSAVQLAFGGNGGNGAMPARFGGRGGNGGNGGFAGATCGEKELEGPCLAIATGGNAGNGGSGRTDVGVLVVGWGGDGGNGGIAMSSSCCSAGSESGISLALAGVGGNGGNGGNSIYGAGGGGGKGRDGGWASATQRLGAIGGAQSVAVSGSGGNGGNGGNSGFANGGAGGGAGGAGAAEATRGNCLLSLARPVQGVAGNAGKAGNGEP